MEHLDKELVCRCEGVTRREIRDAIAAGADSVSWVKRMTRAGMGVCQGRSCGRPIARILHDELGYKSDEVPPDTSRPPARPVALGLLAELYDPDRFDRKVSAAGVGENPLVSRVTRSLLGVGDPALGGPRKEPLKERSTDVAIIGGGSTGSSIAYYLAKSGVKVVLVEKSQIASEGGGRNLGGIRQLGRHPAEMAMALGSTRDFGNLDRELETETEYRQMGYLWVAMNQREWDLQVGLYDQQRDLGADVQLLDREELRRLFPAISDAAVGATYSATDGQADPVKVTRGYARAAIRLGARIFTDTTVTGIRVSKGKVAGITTDRGEIDAPAVLVAAGPWSVELGSMVGLNLPIRPCPNQIMVTEPIPPVLSPLVLSQGAVCLQGRTSNMYVGNTSPPPNVDGMDKRTNLAEMGRTARDILQVVPGLRQARVIRSWVGILDHTPDDIPIMGPAPGLEGLYLACGFSGHGFSLTPQVGRLMAELITSGRTSLPTEQFRPGRFERPGPVDQIEHFTHQRI